MRGGGWEGCGDDGAGTLTPERWDLGVALLGPFALVRSSGWRWPRRVRRRFLTERHRIASLPAPHTPKLWAGLMAACFPAD